MEALIVTSDDDCIRYLSAQLKEKNIVVHLANSSKAAIDIIRKRQPWLVFADIQGEQVEALPILRAIEKERPEVSVVGLAREFDPREALALLRRGLRDYIACPLEEQQSLVQKAIRRARARAVGIVSYMSAHDALEEQHHSIDSELRQLREDQQAGRYVQLKIFPKNPIQIDSFEYAHRIFPSLYLSGDFIDYFALDAQRSFFYFADVSGHGASSAFVTVMLKTISHRWVKDARRDNKLSPANFIRFVNRELMAMELGKHMTLFCGIVDSAQKTLCYSTAAHFPKPRYRNKGEMRSIDDNAMPVGVFDKADYPERSMEIAEDFTLYLFSDGVMDVIEGDSLLDKELVLNRHIDQCQGDIQQLSQSLGLQERSGLPDDIGILLLRHISS